MDSSATSELGMGWSDNGSMKGRPPPLGSEPPQKRMRPMPENLPYADGFAGDQYDQALAVEPPNRPVVDGFTSSEVPQAQSYGHVGSGPFNSAQATPGRGRGAVNVLHKTKLCTRYQAGSCSFNENCNFAHGLEDLRKPPVLREDTVGGSGRGGQSSRPGVQRFQKTRPCRFYIEGNCPYGNRCTFLHDGERNVGQGNGDVRSQSSRPFNWKTRICSRWEKGEICGFGDNCRFAHGPAELQSYGGACLYAGTGVDVNSMNKLSAPYEDSTKHGFMLAAPSNGSDGLPQEFGWGSTGASLLTVGSTQNVEIYKEMSGGQLFYQNTPEVKNDFSLNCGYQSIPNGWEGQLFYQNTPEVKNDFSLNCGYQSIPNGWERSGQALGQEASSNHMYGQAVGQEAWDSSFPTNDLYSGREEKPDYASYSGDQLHENDNEPLTGGDGHYYLADTSSGNEEVDNYAEGSGDRELGSLSGMQNNMDYYAQGSDYTRPYEEPHSWGREG